MTEGGGMGHTIGHFALSTGVLTAPWGFQNGTLEGWASGMLERGLVSSMDRCGYTVCSGSIWKMPSSKPLVGDKEDTSAVRRSAL